jgi:hypothetical protein
MPINYSVDGTQSANFHYKTRLISSYQNKLLYNIFIKGVVPESGTLVLENIAGIEGTAENIQIKIPSGFSFFITPNNRYSDSDIIRNNFLTMSTVNQAITERQILKCDIVKDFYVTPTTIEHGWLVAEYNYLEFTDLPVDFSIVDDMPTDNRVIIGEVIVSGGYISEIDTTLQTVTELNPNIYYEMNIDTLDGYHTGNQSGYIPLSNGVMCEGLNTEMVNGYSGYEAALKWEMSSGLNTQYLADEFGNLYPAGTGNVSVPLSEGLNSVNQYLNTEFLGGSGYASLARYTHEHWLYNIWDGPTVNKPINVNVDHRLTSQSFNDGAFTLPKIDGECFFAYNDADDRGGKLRIVSGEELLVRNLHVIDFVKRNNNVFSKVPHVMIQILDDGINNYDDYYIKMMACNITMSRFEVAYTIYKPDENGYYAEAPVENVWIHWVALGYTEDDIWDR